MLADVPDDARLLKEEIFGPVAPVKAFDAEDEAIAAANDTEFGLVAYVYTSDLKRALRVVERLETGMIGLNQGIVSNPAAPFGGVKQSGFGREGGYEGIEEYLDDEVRRDQPVAPPPRRARIGSGGSAGAGPAPESVLGGASSPTSSLPVIRPNRRARGEIPGASGPVTRGATSGHVRPRRTTEAPPASAFRTQSERSP